jgi:hypothetical protein
MIEKIKIWAEINEIETNKQTNKTYKRSMKPKVGFLKK